MRHDRIGSSRPVGRQAVFSAIDLALVFLLHAKGESEMNLMLMRQIDEQFLETPFFGVRQMTWHLKNEGHPVNEKRIRRLMRLMGLMPIYQKPNTSMQAKGHKIWPYLLKGLRVERPNQAWASDITFFADASWVPLPGRDHGLVHPQGAGVAYLQYAGSRLLSRGVE